MSDVMLQGVLCMPPDLWSDDPLSVHQRHQRYLQAARRIEEDGREIERLREALTEIATGYYSAPEVLREKARLALLVPNACGEPGLTEPGKD